MTSTLSQAILGILSFIRSIVNFIFSTPFPGFSSISIGAVLAALFIVSLGFSYIEYFLNATGVSGKSKKEGK